MFCRLLQLSILGLCGVISVSGASSPWGRNYFPNVPLTTHEGKEVRFFDDLLEDKIVVVNFIYTTCPDTCPLETAQLVKVQEILGDRIGDDVFFYSITIDPENDTVPVLKEYRERFRAKWTFLTGKESDIIKLRKKLGLFIPEIQDGSSNHNVNMIIGNQKTGRWMKRSPFENPFILADQIGNWLDGWRRPQAMSSYLSAPKLRDLPRGEQIFRTRCASCHSVQGEDPVGALGPDLLDVSQRRDRQWLMHWLQAPDKMLQDKDPIAVALFEKYNRLPMPNLRLSREEGVDVLQFLREESQRIHAGEKSSLPPIMNASYRPGATNEGQGDVVAVMNAWVRESITGSRTNAGYLTLVNPGKEDLVLVGVESDAYERVEIHEMAKVDGLMRMRALKDLVVSAGGMAELKSGGKHLMLINAPKKVDVGEEIKVVLKFRSGARQDVMMKVAKP